MSDPELAPRRSLIEACRSINALGISQGTSGNVSLRAAGHMLISPSAVPYDDIEPEHVARLPIDGDDGAWEGTLPPSTEWRFHRDIMRARPDVGAVVHGHPTFCTALAICRRDIPAVHYMMAVFGGDSVRCADYATFGTQALSDHALRALEGRHACLLANHGMIVCGASLARAMWLAVELEALARQYCHSLQIGRPTVLTAEQLAETASKFEAYGRRDTLE